MTASSRKPRIPPTTPRQAAMVQLMRAAGRVQQALEEVCAEYELKHDHYNVLRILRGAHPVGHPRYAISERLISRAPDVTRLLNRLIKDGLVKRYRSSEDQRLSMARATGKGLRLLEEMDPQNPGRAREPRQRPDKSRGPPTFRMVRSRGEGGVGRLVRSSFQLICVVTRKEKS